MELTVTGEGVDVTEATRSHATGQAEHLKQLFASEPEVDICFSHDGDQVAAEIRIMVRGYRTLKAKSKADDTDIALEKAVKKAEWKYRLFFTRGSFRYSDCC